MKKRKQIKRHFEASFGGGDKIPEEELTGEKATVYFKKKPKE